MAFHLLRGYVPTTDRYYELKMNFGWSDSQCFEYLVECVSKCKQQIWQPKASYQQDIVGDLQSSGVIESQFKVFFQNIAGIHNNYASVMRILDTGIYDMIALNETHSPGLHRQIHDCAKRNRYVKLELPARRFSSVGRFCGGTVVFVKKQFVLQNVNKSYYEWGEEVSFILNGQYHFHVVYRNPKSKLQDMFHLFGDLLNTSSYHLFVGDFNAELLSPSTRLRIKYKPVQLKQCVLPTQTMTKPRIADARKNMKLLKPFPLCALSTFSATSAAQRCIDYCLVNQVAARNMRDLKCAVQRGQNITVSDHKFIQFGFTFSQSSLQLPSNNNGCSLRIGKRAVRNNTIGFNALTYLFQLLLNYNLQHFQASLGIAWLSTLVFLSFKVSSFQYGQSFPTQPPAHALIYRKFRSIVQRTPGLQAQRTFLRQQRWKYNILEGCSMTRRLMRTSFTHFSFQQSLKQPYDGQVVQCTPLELSSYYQDFFAGKFSREPTDLADDFLTDYVQLPNDVIDHLSGNISLAELRHVIINMNNNASPGVYGLELGCISQLLSNDSLGDIITELLNRWINEELNTDLFLAIISAIPKPKKPPDKPQNLRPISVTSIWYRLVAKVFTERLKPHLLTLYSTNQHGFCPNRNVLTALLNVRLSTEITLSRKQQLYLLQCDISKAYDNVHRGRLSTVMQHIGIARIPLYQFIERATALGECSVVTQQGLSQAFTSSRGIRQGCPASPIIFSILLSGLERRLLRLHPSLGTTLGDHQIVLSSYADDIKLFGSSLQDICSLFSTTQQFLRQIGLECLAADCKLMAINGAVGQELMVGDYQLTTVPELRFLGVLIDHLGKFRPQQTDYSKALWALFSRVKGLGLSCYPQAYIRAYQTFIQPAVLFGIELWGLDLCLAVLTKGTSPFIHEQYIPILKVFKQWLGLHSTKTFNAPLLKLLGIKPPFIQAFQQIIKLIKNMSPEQWLDVQHVATQVSGGYADQLVTIWEFYNSVNSEINGSLAYEIERTFWQEQQHPGSRHKMFYEVFGFGPQAWNCTKHKSSFHTLRTVASFVCLNLPYFWEAKGSPCALCNEGEQSLLHLLVECQASTACCLAHNVPAFRGCLKHYLLSRTGVQLAALINDLKSVIGDTGRTLQPREVLELGTGLDSSLTKSYIVRFDGSFQLGTGAGVGVTIQNSVSLDLVAEISVPVRTVDAQRTEMIGATLGALLVSVLGGDYVHFEGDSAYVCGLLDFTYSPRDMFFYNCVELTKDFLCHRHWSAKWISRDFNGKCDQLARQAVSSQVISYNFPMGLGNVESSFKRVLSEFQRYFVS